MAEGRRSGWGPLLLVTSMLCIKTGHGYMSNEAQPCNERNPCPKWSYCGEPHRNCEPCFICSGAPPERPIDGCQQPVACARGRYRKTCRGLYERYDSTKITSNSAVHIGLNVTATCTVNNTQYVTPLQCIAERQADQFVTKWIGDLTCVITDKPEVKAILSTSTSITRALSSRTSTLASSSAGYKAFSQKVTSKTWVPESLPAEYEGTASPRIAALHVSNSSNTFTVIIPVCVAVVIVVIVVVLFAIRHHRKKSRAPCAEDPGNGPENPPSEASSTIQPEPSNSLRRNVPVEISDVPSANTDSTRHSYGDTFHPTVHPIQEQGSRHSVHIHIPEEDNPDNSTMSSLGVSPVSDPKQTKPKQLSFDSEQASGNQSTPYVSSFSPSDSPSERSNLLTSTEYYDLRSSERIQDSARTRSPMVPCEHSNPCSSVDSSMPSHRSKPSEIPEPIQDSDQQRIPCMHSDQYSSADSSIPSHQAKSFESTNNNDSITLRKAVQRSRVPTQHEESYNSSLESKDNVGSLSSSSNPSHSIQPLHSHDYCLRPLSPVDDNHPPRTNQSDISRVVTTRDVPNHSVAQPRREPVEDDAEFPSSMTNDFTTLDSFDHSELASSSLSSGVSTATGSEESQGLLGGASGDSGVNE